MANSSTKPQQSLFEFYDELFRNIFVQPSDELSLKTFDTTVSKTLDQRMNLNRKNFSEFKETVMGARKLEMAFVLEEHVPLLEVEESVGDGSGSLASRARFRVEEKGTGKQLGNNIDVVMISVIKVENDGQGGARRVLSELTEVDSSGGKL